VNSRKGFCHFGEDYPDASPGELDYNGELGFGIVRPELVWMRGE
jgi:hypothetical protein